MNTRWIFILALVLTAGAIFGADQPAAPQPAPFNLEALTGQLSMLQFGARNTPALAITHDQAQQLLPILKKWQANPTLSPTASKDLFNQAEAVLTADQKAFKPVRGARQGGPAGSGGGPGQGAGGFRNQGGAASQNLSYQDRMKMMLDRLIQRLEGL